MIEIQQHEPGKPDTDDRYEALDRSLRASNFDGSAAQAHGIACGLVCRNIKSTELDKLSTHLSLTDDASISALESLIEMAERDLNQAGFGFDLWLPDTEALDKLSPAMADWSQGFIIALMHDGADIRTQLSEELNESVQDIIEIAGLEQAAGDSTEDELAMVEIREYLRMATQLIYEELNPDRPIDSAQD